MARKICAVSDERVRAPVVRNINLSLPIRSPKQAGPPAGESRAAAILPHTYFNDFNFETCLKYKYKMQVNLKKKKEYNNDYKEYNNDYNEWNIRT